MEIELHIPHEDRHEEASNATEGSNQTRRHANFRPEALWHQLKDRTIAYTQQDDTDDEEHHRQANG
jgi:hypothetical protein